MTNDMRRGARVNSAMLHATVDEVVRPMMRMRCKSALPRGKERRFPLLRRLLYPFIGQVTSPCPHRTDGTMCDECGWRWAIR